MPSRFEILRSIAKGGMAEVFRARAVGVDGLSKVVALKRIAPWFMDDKQAVNMLKDEARLALRLNHPNIIQVFEFDRDAEGYFLVMEFVDGPDLAELLQARRDRESRLPEACAVAIGISLLRALDYAHHLTDEHGQPLHVVHRDVSPGNVLLSSDGVVKLGDFGIAKARGRLQTTQAGTVKGKIPYMAPEQLKGGLVDGRSDLFSASLVLWECLAGVRAYPTKNEAELVRRVLHGEVRTFSEVGVEVHSRLAEIVERGMREDPAHRFQTAEAMAQALEKYHRRAHPDFGPEYLAALLSGTVPSTLVTASPSTEAVEVTESAILARAPRVVRRGPPPPPASTLPGTKTKVPAIPESPPRGARRRRE